VTDAGDHARPTLPRLEHGSVFAGYWIDGLIDRGGMGVVYKAMDVDLDRAVALKLIAPEYTEDETAATRFKTESRLAASLEHPNIVPVHRGGEENGVLYLAMRFVPGTNLRRLVNRGPMPLDVTADVMTQIAGALDAAHARGMVHRDVKPANILLSDETAHTHAYLTDFGLTKRPGSTGNLTGTGLWVGTADYVAPEQIQGETIDGRADIYSLGCVLYEMLTGAVPYPKDGDIAKLWAHISNPPPQPTAARHDLLPVFDEIVARATAKDRAERYATAGELAVAVREAIAQQQSHAGAAAPPMTYPPTPAPTAQPSEPPAPIAQPTQPSAYPPPASVPPASMPPASTPPISTPPTPVSMPAASAPAASIPAAAPPPADASMPPAPPPQPSGPSGPPPSRGRRGLAAVLGAVAIVAIAIVAVVVLAGGGSDNGSTTSTSKQAAGTKAPPGAPLKSTLGPVPTNHVTGAGAVTMRLNGDKLTVDATAEGLLDAKHAMHIHAGAKGVCPPAAAAKDHNGHLSISTIDGVPWYGPPVTALTTRGDTSAKSILAFNRFLSGSDIHYTRTITLTPVVAANIRNNDAVVIVHGIDYDHDGTYGNVLDRSDLDRALPGEITAPALCGQIVPVAGAANGPTKTAQVPGSGGTVYMASLQKMPGDTRLPSDPALLCTLGAQGDGDGTAAWDA
jgi:serine/threonine protein kinase